MTDFSNYPGDFRLQSGGQKYNPKSGELIALGLVSKETGTCQG